MGNTKTPNLSHPAGGFFNYPLHPKPQHAPQRPPPSFGSRQPSVRYTADLFLLAASHPLHRPHLRHFHLGHRWQPFIPGNFLESLRP